MYFPPIFSDNYFCLGRHHQNNKVVLAATGIKGLRSFMQPGPRSSVDYTKGCFLSNHNKIVDICVIRNQILSDLRSNAITQNKSS